MCPIVPDDCEEPICGGNGTNFTGKDSDDVDQTDGGTGPFAQARSFEPRADALLQPAEDGALMASYSVFVVEPGASVGEYQLFLLSSLLHFKDKPFLCVLYFFMCLFLFWCSFRVLFSHFCYNSGEWKSNSKSKKRDAKIAFSFVFVSGNTI